MTAIEADARSDSGTPLLMTLLRLRTLIALFLVMLVFSIATPQFLSAANFLIMFKHVAIVAILAVGMTFVILTGGIDLSVGSIVGLSGMVAGALILHGIPLGPLASTLYPGVPVVVAIALAVGALVGAINGLLVTRCSVAPFIATLGTLYIARGTALLLSNGATFPNLVGSPLHGNEGFAVIGGGAVLGLPLAILIMVVIALAAAFVTRRLPLGRRIYAVGGNERAARLSGVRVDRVKIAVYMISGLCAAVVGLIVASELVAAHPASGETFELSAIAAVVLGGASLSGGRGTIGGSVIGACVIGVLADGMVMMGISEFWQMVIKGLVIVAAVVLDQFQVRVGGGAR